MRKVFSSIVAVAGLAILSAPALSKEKVGEVTLARTSVTGDSRPLRVKAPVHRDERIRTSGTGLGEFLFRDGTKFAVGWNSSVVIDDFVFNDRGSARKVTVKAAKGTFRWISGHSRSSAYSIATPAGTLGIRGTAFDLYVGPNGTTAVVLLSGEVQFCGRGGCRELTKRCDVVVATPRGGITNPRRVNGNIFDTLRSGRALPFQSGHQRLSNRFRSGPSCLAAARVLEPERLAPRPAPNRANPPGPAPEPPAAGAEPPSARPEPPSPRGPAPEPPSRPEPERNSKNPNNGRGNGGGDGSPGGNAANDGDPPSTTERGNKGRDSNNGRGKGVGGSPGGNRGNDRG